MDACTKLVSVVIPVFRDGRRALAAVDAILSQSLPEHMEREVIVVDDGSDDDTAALLSECKDASVRICSLENNQGRSSARNVGASYAKGDFIVFMDCDCLPEDGFLAAHIEALSGGAVASTGHVSGWGSGFWDTYQDDSSNRRRKQHAEGLTWSGSSQNLGVLRDAFLAAGGFDIGYQRYGFEDRDLLLRISEFGPIFWTNDAVVRHQDQLTLSQVSAKMQEAGKHTSGKFSRRHPQAYRSLGYAAFDANSKPLAQKLAPIAKVLAALVAGGFDCFHSERWLPYSIAKQIVRATSALSYFSGTAERS